MQFVFRVRQDNRPLVFMVTESELLLLLLLSIVKIFISSPHVEAAQ